jgi:hypothetical protein
MFDRTLKHAAFHFKNWTKLVMLVDVVIGNKDNAIVVLRLSFRNLRTPARMLNMKGPLMTSSNVLRPDDVAPASTVLSGLLGSRYAVFPWGSFAISYMVMQTTSNLLCFYLLRPASCGSQRTSLAAWHAGEVRRKPTNPTRIETSWSSNYRSMINRVVLRAALTLE